jgi:hypothetical protein
MQAALQQPSWEEILQVLQNDIALHYKVDIETNSTIDAEAAQDKQDIAELLNALSQFLNGLGPLVKDGIMPFDIAKNMLLVIARRYNFGSQLEDSLLSMAAPKPQEAQTPDPADQAKAQAEMAKAQASMAQTKLDAQVAQAEHQATMQEMAAKAELAKLELAIKRDTLLLQQKALEQKLRLQQASHAMKLQAMEASEERQEHSNADV